MDSLVGVSAGMTTRLAFAVIAAAGIGFWLWRCKEGGDNRWAAQLRLAALALGGFWSATWIVLALIRLRYPFELEWCGGAMRDMAARAMHGEPMYVAPGGGWFPYEYPPLYLWLSGWGMRLIGTVSFAPMRLLSIASTIGSATLIGWWVRRLAGSRTWGLIAAGIFLASYRFTGAWYDVERLDMLFLFLSLAGICMLQRADETDSAPWAAAAAAAHLLAFLTKQQAVLFVVGGIAALAVLKKGRLLAVYGFASVLLCLGSVAALNRATDGWFGYYCFRVPMANGIRLNLARTYLFADLPLFAPTIAIIMLTLARKRSEPSTLLWSMTAMGMLGSLLSRAHWGGDQNVLMTGYVFLGIAACALAGQLSAASPSARAPLFALVLAQLLVVTYRPAAQLPRTSGLAAGERYSALIHDLEREGEVLSLDHGGFTTSPHFHLMGLLDVMQTEKGLPTNLLDSIRSHRYSSVVMDAKPENEGYLGVIASEYPRMENVGIGDTWVVTGFPTPSPGRTVWVLRRSRRTAF
jgi:hypothetical protein